MDSEAMAKPEISLLSLPDDALLAVLAFLPTRDLFVCRVACRRLRDLCLHRHLWRAATVESKGVLRAALAVAPCIGTIGEVPIEALEPLVATACTVSELKLLVVGKESAALASALLSRFSTVSSGLRLKKLSLEVRGPLTRTSRRLLKQVCSFTGLQDLSIDLKGELPEREWSKLNVQPSLSKLSYTSSSRDAFLQLLLSTHSATLENVDLQFREYFELPWRSLASLSRLRSLRCFQDDGLSKLAALPNLNSVELEANDQWYDGFDPGAVEFLSKAPHLRMVKLGAVSHDTAPLLALANSPSAPHLEKLHIYPWFQDLDDESNVFDTLASVLQEFVSLNSLIAVIDELPYDLLQVISPISSPKLTVLVLADVTGEKFKCLHETLHDPFVQDLLVGNPQLHLRLKAHDEDMDLKSCKSCSWCRRSCHVRLRRDVRVALSSHCRRGGCPVDCYQAFQPSDRTYSESNPDLS
ncbi:uncharacterized protein LOC117651625 [Thrips palmi]|uniref:Uncharacterized protein LOC117651625 n=1 Tax=Thrips palmi TaxID=161013 RepID=A0A6P9A1M9_THRPL|nr:uncharacterized protein LOC117651625 [Thrips palmi]XP_034251692.1 uncharacterized protein LOC117651625 [Thrips palmi]XP_034251693.1 uncharacterized protein LOC117651625 [Thrips palmi]XP_034251695.1 uncharacterized protein LOC117651625 [Thrips palmi]XP_034251696.1 uncharacterized protein LOC117651625 [Thrips palmi]XP_034251697.1 uncharacterized protein LOC117651625 [Thrips palmi]